MNHVAASTGSSVRPLRDDDLERIIAIDSSHVGESRRRFFEKRLDQAKRHPEDFVHIGVISGNALVGFAFARILRGEFGRKQATATLDAVGVEHDSQTHGVGRMLMTSLMEIMSQKGVQSLQSQATWTSHALLRFFDASGFRLAPRITLERSVLTPLAESIEGD